MIFRNHDGNLQEVKRCEYKNDMLYYQQIRSIKSKLYHDKNGTIKLRDTREHKPHTSTIIIDKLLQSF
jgi:hypothetical protein